MQAHRLHLALLQVVGSVDRDCSVKLPGVL